MQNETIPHDQVELRAPVRIECTAQAADRLVKLMAEAGPAPEKLEGQTVSDEAGVRRIIALAGMGGLDVFVSEDRHTVTISTPEKIEVGPAGIMRQLAGLAKEAANKVADKTLGILGYSGPMAKGERNSPCPCGSGKKYKKCCRPGDMIGRVKK